MNKHDHKNEACPPRWARLTKLLATVLFALLFIVGCLGEPEVDERWTLLENLNSAPADGDVAQSNSQMPVTVDARITYRQILTGFLVAEARYAATVPPTIVELDPTQASEDAIAADIDMILANSVTAGRATRAVTGFDHLMQDFTLQFTAGVPDSLRGGGFYILLYMGDGDEIELQDGRDSLVVTPWLSTDKELLHTGFFMSITP